MQWALGKVLEDEDHIELLEAELNTFQRGNLDVSQGDYEERRIGQVDQTFRSWLQANVLTDRNTLERKLTEGYVDFESISGLFGL